MTDPLLERGIRFSRAQGNFLVRVMDTLVYSSGAFAYTAEAKEVHATILNAARNSYSYEGIRVDRWSQKKIAVLLDVIRYTIESEGVHPVQRIALKRRAREVMQVAGWAVVDQLAWLTA